MELLREKDALHAKVAMLQQMVRPDFDLAENVIEMFADRDLIDSAREWLNKERRKAL